MILNLVKIDYGDINCYLKNYLQSYIVLIYSIIDPIKKNVNSATFEAYSSTIH